MTNQEFTNILIRIRDFLDETDYMSIRCLITDTIVDLGWRGFADKGMRIKAIKAARDQFGPDLGLLDAKYMVDGRIASQAALHGAAPSTDPASLARNPGYSTPRYDYQEDPVGDY